MLRSLVKQQCGKRRHARRTSHCTHVCKPWPARAAVAHLVAASQLWTDVVAKLIVQRLVHAAQPRASSLRLPGALPPPVSCAPTTHSHASLSALTRTGAATSGCSGCARLKQQEFWRRPLDSLRLLGKQLAGCAEAVQRYCGIRRGIRTYKDGPQPYSTNSLPTGREVVELLVRCSTHAHGGRM